MFLLIIRSREFLSSKLCNKLIMNDINFLIFYFSRGQLGRGLLIEEQGPEVVPALEGIRIQSVATGGWHSAAISGEKKKTWRTVIHKS